MDTYGDMVTLLLCFFVLLYSISTIDQQKWLIVVRSFNKDAIEITPGPDPNSSKSEARGDSDPATDMVETDLTELYEFLVEYAGQQNAESGTEGQVLVSRGDDYVFISFSDAVFFDGDSSVLRQEGKDVLNGIIPALEKCAPSIDELRVLGHTAQARVDVPNPSRGDRVLAGSRAGVVAAHIQDSIPYDVLHPARIVSVGYGQWRNVSPNDVEENKAKNRRVELVITGKDLENELSDSVKQYETMYESTKELKTTD